jgi:hypothetical protein
MKFSGWATVGWIVGGAAWIATSLVGLPAADRTGGFYAAETAWLVVHLLILLGLVGLVRSDAVGDLGWGAQGFLVAIGGRMIFLVAEVASIAVGHDDLFVFPPAVVLTAVGMIVGGLAVVRAGRWKGALRFAPLAMGVFPFLAIFPILAATGERPPDMILACWGGTMLAVGLAMASLTKVEPSVPRI